LKIIISTTSHRKLVEHDFRDVPAGTFEERIRLADKAGKALSNGLYYVQIRLAHGESYTKLLVLR